MKQFNFTLSTPDAVLFDGETEEVMLETPNGEIGILADHIPLVSLISAGAMRIKTKGEEKILAVGAGFVKVTKDKVNAFTQTAEFAESIDEQRALQAQKEALEAMQGKTDDISLADAAGLLERNAARLRVVERKKKRSHH